MKRAHVCTTPGCPHLQPCPTHARPENAQWGQRDNQAQAIFHNAVFARSLGHCERCGARATQAHHVKPGYSADCGLALCDDCHTKVDDKARRTRRFRR